MNADDPRTNVIGRCRKCGRESPAKLRGINSAPNVVAEGECPRCGASPFVIDRIGAYVMNIGRLEEAEAIRFAREQEWESDIEILFRAEIMATGGRDAVLQALIGRYDELDVGSISAGFVKAQERLPLPELKAAILAQFDADPELAEKYRAVIYEKGVTK